MCYEGNSERWVGGGGGGGRLVCRFHAIPCHHNLVHKKPANLLCSEGDNGRVGWVKVCGFQTYHHNLVHEETTILVCSEGDNGRVW